MWALLGVVGAVGLALLWKRKSGQAACPPTPAVAESDLSELQEEWENSGLVRTRSDEAQEALYGGESGREPSDSEIQLRSPTNSKSKSQAKPTKGQPSEPDRRKRRHRHSKKPKSPKSPSKKPE